MALRSISYITIHNTDTYSLGATAQASANYLSNNSQGTQASWHYTVDDINTIQSFPDNMACWHAGDGSGDGNYTSIGIEISTNWGFVAKGQSVAGIKNWDEATADEKANAELKFLKACDNAAQLTADLLKAHSLGIDKVVQHNYWKSSKYPTGKNCPYAIRLGLFNTSWDWFLGLVNKYYKGVEECNMKYFELYKEDMNLRSGIGTNYPVLIVIPKGTVIEVSQVSGTWGKTTYNGKSGWCSITASYAREVSAPVTPPIAAETVQKSEYDKVVAERDQQRQRAEIAEQKLAQIKSILS